MILTEFFENMSDTGWYTFGFLIVAGAAYLFFRGVFK